jgi:hypothetical protein
MQTLPRQMPPRHHTAPNRSWTASLAGRTMAPSPTTEASNEISGPAHRDPRGHLGARARHRQGGCGGGRGRGRRLGDRRPGRGRTRAAARLGRGARRRPARRGRRAGLLRRGRRARPPRLTAGESLQLGLVAETPVDDARRALDLRIWGAYTAVKHGAPRLREGGSIVLTSGSAGLDQIKLADAGIVSPARGGSADDSKAWLPSDVRVSPGRSQVRHVRHASVRAQC